MNHAVVLSAALPITLFCLMFSMGTRLRVEDFLRLFESPRTLSLGLFCQMICLPLLAVVIVYLLQPEPLIAVGILILSFSPGGATSNALSYLARGNLALSVSLTAIASLVTPFTIPLLTNLALQWQLSSSGDIVLPLLPAVVKLCVITIIPIVSGMILRHFHSRFCEKYSGYLLRVPLLMLAGVIFAIVLQNWHQMPELLPRAGIPALLLATLALVSGYFLAKRFQLNARDARTIGMETGIQNAGTAIVVTGTLLQDPVMTIAPTLYGIFMLIPAIFYILYFRRWPGE